MNNLKVVISGNEEFKFNNQVDFCVGTGRMGLALQKEYQEQLKLVQEAIGFKHIRGHGLFTDDMAIYQEKEVNGERIVEYNYTYLDLVMDSYRELGLKPFLELGFMPEKMASGTQTVFYWKGNTTPPKSYGDWNEMVKALLRHLIERYGLEEVITWPIEVWNEPNLPGFWEKADMQEYFKLFKNSFYAIKEVDDRFRVGGPAVCGGTDEIWIKGFMEFCHENKIPVDFVTRHHYTTELPDDIGHYGYAELEDSEYGFANLHTTREIIDSYEEYKGLEIHITEFNTSYIPNCPIHDTNQNAAFIANQLSRLGDDNESYSYWTFGDIFEERGVPFTPFHGGFGMVANGCIPKPTFYTFAFFKKLKEKDGKCIYKDDKCVIMKYSEDEYRGVMWNATRKRYGSNICLDFEINSELGEYTYIAERVDENTTNPLKVWHDMGEPSSLSADQKSILQAAAKPLITSTRIKNDTGKIYFSEELDEHAVVYFKITKSEVKPDRGYFYDRVMQDKGLNPITKLDYPDPDVIRVDDTFYMVTTTMHFMPGCEILMSKDLVNWEHCTYVYNKLDSTSAQTLEEGNIYGKGMWAASLRYNNGTFYVCFVANDTGKTYLYKTNDINSEWEKHTIEGFYHDCSLLFDDDGKIYIAYGNTNIRITELDESLSGPKESGLDRVVVNDEDNKMLGYEGTHFYKINGKYYIFLIHSLKNEWRRVEACYMSDSLEGDFVGGDILNDDIGYCNQGVAQGGIVDTIDGKWYAILFQDRGAVGRIPVLVPVNWKDNMPVFGNEGSVPKTFERPATDAFYEFKPLVFSDDFKVDSNLCEEDKKRQYGCFGLKSIWQFNHEPDVNCIEHDAINGAFSIITDRICQNVLQAKNTLTQRMVYPGCSAEVSLDISGLNEGDFAGLCALQGEYAFVGATKRDGKKYIVVYKNVIDCESDAQNIYDGEECELIEVENDVLRLRLDSDFTDMKDEVALYYKERYFWKKLSSNHKLHFRLDHFTGCRFALFAYSTKQAGGRAKFSDFRYIER